MKKTLYLHIGRPKVASTTIQHFLDGNREVLLNHGCLYPESGLSKRGSHALSMVLLPNLHDYELFAHLDIDALYSALQRELTESPAPMGIVLSENFFLVDPLAIPAFFRQAFDIRVICYVRRQDDVALSSFVQEVRMGHAEFGGDLDHYLQVPQRLHLLDYAAVLDSWSRAFGAANICVRVFEECRAGEGVELDLLRTLGLDPALPDWSLRRHAANVSPPRDVLELISEVQRLPLSKAQRRQVVNRYSSAGRQLAFDPRYDSRGLLTLVQRQRLMARFEQSNAEVARRYLGREDGRLFPDAEPDPAEPPPYPGVQFDRYRLVVAGIIAEQQQQIVSLNSKLCEQELRLQRIDELLNERA